MGCASSKENDKNAAGARGVGGRYEEMAEDAASMLSAAGMGNAGATICSFGQHTQGQLIPTPTSSTLTADRTTRGQRNGTRCSLQANSLQQQQQQQQLLYSQTDLPYFRDFYSYDTYSVRVRIPTSLLLLLCWSSTGCMQLKRFASLILWGT